MNSHYLPKIFCATVFLPNTNIRNQMTHKISPKLSIISILVGKLMYGVGSASLDLGAIIALKNKLHLFSGTKPDPRLSNVGQN